MHSMFTVTKNNLFGISVVIFEVSGASNFIFARALSRIPLGELTGLENVLFESWITRKFGLGKSWKTVF